MAASVETKTVFKAHRVAPDVIPSAPPKVCEVKWDGARANLGNKLTPTQVHTKPAVKWHAKEDTLYTLIMTDPDAPSRKDPKFREWRHWTVVNIPGCDVDKGEEVVGYIGSAPPKDSGPHRYVILVYEQPGRVEVPDRIPSTSSNGRPKWNASGWVAQHNIGRLYAGNFFQAEWDDYVPKIYEQLKD